jgi:aromatic-L-amino-acid/L-tryptophan decarboxylase
MSLKVFGAAAFRAAIDQGLALAEYAESRLRDDAAFEVVTPARLGIVTFRLAAPGAADSERDELIGRLPAAALSHGFAYLSTTRVGAANVLRFCTINPRTTREDVDRTIGLVSTLAAELR